VYRDGQFDDARLAVALAQTASAAGATVVNHARVERLLFDEDASLTDENANASRVDGRRGTSLRDRRKSLLVKAALNGSSARWCATRENREARRSRCARAAVVNATGPFTDFVRRMVDVEREEIMTPRGGNARRAPRALRAQDVRR
jgi:glycerol-3-phosphate dehydrogenase